MLITLAEIVELCAIHKKIDKNLLEPNIDEAQERYIKSALGKEFYDELVFQLSTDPTTLSVANEKFMPFLKKALARFVIFVSIPKGFINISSQGAMINRTEFSDSASKSDVAYIRQDWLSSAEFFRDEMLQFLKDNITDYPTYFKSCIMTPSGKKRTFIIH